MGVGGCTGGSGRSGPVAAGAWRVGIVGDEMGDRVDIDDRPLGRRMGGRNDRGSGAEHIGFGGDRDWRAVAVLLSRDWAMGIGGDFVGRVGDVVPYAASGYLGVRGRRVDRDHDS